MSLIADACVFIRDVNWHNTPQDSLIKIIKNLHTYGLKKVILFFDDQLFSMNQLTAIKALCNETKKLYEDNGMKVILAIASNEEHDSGFMERFYLTIKSGAQHHYQAHLDLQMYYLAIFLKGNNFSQLDGLNILKTVQEGIEEYFSENNMAISAEHLNYRALYLIFEQIKEKIKKKNSHLNADHIKKQIRLALTNGSEDLKKANIERKEIKNYMQNTKVLLEELLNLTTNRQSLKSSGQKTKKESSAEKKPHKKPKEEKSKETKKHQSNKAAIFYKNNSNTLDMKKHLYEAYLIHINTINKIKEMYAINNIENNNFEKCSNHIRQQTKGKGTSQENKSSSQVKKNSFPELIKALETEIIKIKEIYDFLYNDSIGNFFLSASNQYIIPTQKNQIIKEYLL
jgi:hypothetical protein